MCYIDRDKHFKLINDLETCLKKCEDNDDIKRDLENILNEYNKVITGNTIQYSSTWLLEKDLWLQCENSLLDFETDKLSRGRVVSVNPGVSNIGREQRFIHPYIILGEYEGTFIGVPITNMAYKIEIDKETQEEKKIFYLRNVFEVELINPEGKKPFTEFRLKKPSIADIRNISGFDKRRIIKNQLYSDKKFAPETYLNAISEKIRETLAIIV